MLRHDVKFVTTPESTLLMSFESVFPLMGVRIAATQVLQGLVSKDTSDYAEDNNVEVVRGAQNTYRATSSPRSNPDTTIERAVARRWAGANSPTSGSTILHSVLATSFR